MSDLFALAYLSTARQRMSAGELKSIVDASLRNNGSGHITGVLLYCNGSFMQYIEGPKAAVLDLYQRVKADDRHHGLIELFRAPVAHREFADWSMGYAQTMAPNLQALGLADWKPPTVGTPSPGHVLLSNFWCNNC